MITLANIMKAITIEVRNTLGVKANDRDIEEGFDRPSFYLDVDGISDSNIGDEGYRYDTYDLVLYFFAEKRKTGFLDVLNAREKLRELLDSRIECEGGFGITFDDVEHTINKADKSLITKFSVLAVQRKPDTSTEPYMEDLDFNIKQ